MGLGTCLLTLWYTLSRPAFLNIKCLISPVAYLYTQAANRIAKVSVKLWKQEEALWKCLPSFFMQVNRFVPVKRRGFCLLTREIYFSPVWSFPVPLSIHTSTCHTLERFVVKATLKTLWYHQKVKMNCYCGWFLFDVKKYV